MYIDIACDVQCDVLIQNSKQSLDMLFEDRDLQQPLQGADIIYMTHPFTHCINNAIFLNACNSIYQSNAKDKMKFIGKVETFYEIANLNTLIIIFILTKIYSLDRCSTTETHHTQPLPTLLLVSKLNSSGIGSNKMEFNLPGTFSSTYHGLYYSKCWINHVT